MWYLSLVFLAGCLLALFGLKISYGSFSPFVRIVQFGKDSEDREWRNVFVKIMKRSKREVIFTTLKFYTSRYEEIQSAIKDAISRGVKVTMYYPPDKMPKDIVSLLEKLGCIIKPVPLDTFEPHGAWNHIMIIDERDWVYLPSHPPGVAGVHEGQIGFHDLGRAKRWKRDLEEMAAKRGNG